MNVNGMPIIPASNEHKPLLEPAGARERNPTCRVSFVLTHAIGLSAVATERPR